jgi:hypothetical protein
MQNLTEEQRRVFVAAIEVAIAPHAKNRHTFAAKVPWKRVEELRDALEAAGIDWQKVQRTQDERDAAVRAAEQAS